MKLILHIGTDKTGTTAIQRHVYSNRKWLLERDVFVPLTGLGKDNGHSTLLRTLHSESLSDLADEIAVAQSEGYGCALLSWEGMSFMPKKEIDDLTRKLRLDNLWLLVYLREQADIVQSGYLQEIKTTGSPVNIEDFQRRAVSLRGFHARLYCYARSRDYARMLKRWVHVIKRGQFIIREFQRDKLLNGSVVDDFFSTLGLVPDREFTRVERLSNRSLDVQSAILMNEFDARTNDSLRRRDMSSLLQSLVDSEASGTRYFLSRQQVNAIRRHYRRSNACIPDITGTTISPLFQTPPDCFTDDTAATLMGQVKTRAEKCEALQEIPILFASKIPHRRPSQDMLITGWALRERDARTVGNLSVVRVRVPFWMSTRSQGEIIIFLRGRYTLGQFRTQVNVNDVDFGWQDLSAFSEKIRLPASALGTNQILEINLHHEWKEDLPTPVSDAAVSAFSLRRIGIQFFQPD